MIGLRASQASLESGAARPVGRAMRRMGWLAGAALCALTVPAHAQDDVADDPAQTAEAERNFGTVIVVTSERRATNLQDTPISVVAITEEAAASKGIEDLEDLSKFTPNLSITPSRGGGNNTANFVIRGIGGEPVGALSVAVPKARYDETVQRRVMDLIERTAGLLEVA